MELHRVSVFAPATVANVGSAFDVLGFAINAPGDTVTATRTEKSGVLVSGIEGDGGRLPIEANKNTAGVGVQSMLQHLSVRFNGRYDGFGVDLHLKKGLPIGSGLGSSSASSVAAVLGVNVLLGEPLTRRELLPFAMEGERVACGAAHADNVAPSLLGGFVLIRSYDPLDIITLPSPRGAWITVITPKVELRTEDARKILRRSVSLTNAISQWGNVAALIAGIFRNDVELMGRSLEDKVIEPERAALIPGFYEAKKAALDTGAYGCSISGSGPSIFAISGSEINAKKIGSAMVAHYVNIQVETTTHISPVNPFGAVVLSKE